MTGGTTATVLAGAAALAFAFGGETVAGVPTAEAAALLLYAAGILWLTGWAVSWGRPSGSSAAGAVAMWTIFVTSLTGLYLHRDEAFAGLRAAVEDIGYGPAPLATVTGAGEVAITRRGDGTFQLQVAVNDKSFRFVFDTGASTVVLKPETAEALGIGLDTLRYRVQVLTANGAMLAAPVTLDRVAIGPIRLSRVPALVTRSGVLHENLLGQTVLDRLESYEVRGNRLVLRAGKG